MPFQKQYGPVSINEAGGVVSVSVSLVESAGGGSVAGFASASVSAQVQLSAKQLIDAGFALAADKFPAAAALIAVAQGAIDAEIAKA